MGSSDGSESSAGCNIGIVFKLERPKIPHHFINDATPNSKSFSTFLDLWHSRLCHASFSRVKSLALIGVLGDTTTNTYECLSYQLGKQHALLFNNSESSSIHSDICGPTPIHTVGES